MTISHTVIVRQAQIHHKLTGHRMNIGFISASCGEHSCLWFVTIDAKNTLKGSPYDNLDILKVGGRMDTEVGNCADAIVDAAQRLAGLVDREKVNCGLLEQLEKIHRQLADLVEAQERWRHNLPYK